MSFLRLGTISAIMDDEGLVLLSKRGDLNIWALPGGRLDAGEPLFKAAKREVIEETGIHPHIENALNLYYWRGWQRMNILFEGAAIGGRLHQQTDETRENAFLPVEKLSNPLAQAVSKDLTTGERPYPHIIQTHYLSQQIIRLKFAWRWIYNLLRGKPEPRHVRFIVKAVAVIRSNQSDRVLTLRTDRSSQLPGRLCSGKQAPWVELAHYCRQYTTNEPRFHWVGVHHILNSNALTFVFAAKIDENSNKHPSEWVSPQNVALDRVEAMYTERVSSNYHQQSVWVITETEKTPYSLSVDADIEIDSSESSA